MKVVLSIIAFAAIANARPDVSHVPSGSYLPTYQGSVGSDSHHQSEDQRNVYFYASPKDGHYTHFRINIVPKSHKNTKIIFVKAPHHAGVIPEVVAPPSLSEDKTVVYVLVKKPIDGQSISIPAGLGVKQLKPEVFFLNYNNKHDAEHQVHSGIQGNRVGVNVPDLGNEQAFIGALGSGHGPANYGNYGGAGFSAPGGSTSHGPAGASGPY